MEELGNYNMKRYKLVVWFFRIMVSLIIIMITLLFVLRINETVSIENGEIVSANPQSDYKAPFEASLRGIKVKEGDQVKAGDTLLIIQSQDFVAQYSRKQAEIEYLNRRIASISVLQKALEKKKTVVGRENILANEGFALQKQRLSTAAERLRADSILYQKDMLSKAEFNNTKDANLLLKESFTREQSNFVLRQVSLEENYHALMQSKIDFEGQLIQAKEALKQLRNELGKQYIIASQNGTVNYIFNIRNTTNLITKGDLLVSVAPQDLNYYAKATISQKDIRYLKEGLDTRLKLDAYSQFESGIIKGKVSYVAERKENEKFYALIQLSEVKDLKLKAGYSVQGKIIIQRMPLYKYIVKSLFKNLYA